MDPHPGLREEHVQHGRSEDALALPGAVALTPDTPVGPGIRRRQQPQACRPPVQVLPGRQYGHDLLPDGRVGREPEPPLGRRAPPGDHSVTVHGHQRPVSHEPSSFAPPRDPGRAPARRCVFRTRICPASAARYRSGPRDRCSDPVPGHQDREGPAPGPGRSEGGRRGSPEGGHR